MTDYFSRHPDRILDAHASGDLTFKQFALISWFVARLDHPARVRTISYSLPMLVDALGWEDSEEWLRQNLHSIRRWVAFETRRGPKAIWTFSLAAARINGDCQLETPSELEKADGTLTFDRPVEGHGESGAETRGTRSVGNSYFSSKKRSKKNVLGEETKGDALSSKEREEDDSASDFGGGARFDDDKLRVLTDQAFELRETPYLRDAAEAIVESHSRRALRRWERDRDEKQ